MSNPSDRLKNLVEFLGKFNADTSPRLIRASWAALLLSGIVILLISTLTLRHQKDFSQDYFAAQAFFEGKSIYSKRVIELGKIFNGRGIENAHPPSLVFALLPVTALPYTSAFLIYTAISVITYVASLLLAGRLMGLSRVYLRLLISASLLWPATLQSVHQGSVSFLIASLTILGWVYIRRTHTKTAAAVLGVATALKFFPGILIFPFILRRDWQGCLMFVASFGSLVLSSLLLFGLQDWEIFVKTIAPHVSHEFSTHYANISLWAYILPWFTTQPHLPPLFENPFVGTMVVFLVAAVLLSLTIHGQMTANRRKEPEKYNYWLWALCSVLLTPVSWQYSLTFLPVPVALLIANAVTNQRAYLFGATIITCILLTLADYDSYSLLLKRAADAPLSGSLRLYLSYLLYTKIQITGVFLLFGLLVRMRAYEEHILHAVKFSVSETTGLQN